MQGLPQRDIYWYLQWNNSEISAPFAEINLILNWCKTFSLLKENFFENIWKYFYDLFTFLLTCILSALNQTLIFFHHYIRGTFYFHIHPYILHFDFHIQFTLYIHIFQSFFAFFFSGMWDDDKASGLGTLEYSNGDLYEGEWENDQRNGNEIYNIFYFCNYWLQCKWSVIFFIFTLFFLTNFYIYSLWLLKCVFLWK